MPLDGGLEKKKECVKRRRKEVYQRMDSQLTNMCRIADGEHAGARRQKLVVSDSHTVRTI